MKNTLLLSCAFLLLWAFSCKRDADNQQESTNQPPLTEALPGTWQMTYLRVEMDSYGGVPDSTVIFEAKEETWEDVYHVKPYRIFFGPENKFHTTYRSVTNDILSETEGMWTVKGDTLTLVDPGLTIQYKIKLEKGMAHLSALLDWDGDGQEDDVYYGIQRYISKSSAE